MAEVIKETKEAAKTDAPLVYLANVGLHDYSAVFDWTPLREYGVRQVTSGDIDRKNPQRLVANIVNGLKHFRPIDYFVFSGSPIPFALGLAYLLRKNNTVKVLYFMNSQNKYFCIEYLGTMFDGAEELDFTAGATPFQWEPQRP